MSAGRGIRGDVDVPPPTAATDSGSSSLMPDSRFINLKAGQALLWTGDMLHRGRTPAGQERLTLSCSWSKWNACMHAPPPDYRDRTVAWKLEPAVRAALPTEWMRTAWDRWVQTQNTTAERWMGPNPNFKEKEGVQTLRGSGEGSMVGGVGDGVSSSSVPQQLLPEFWHAGGDREARTDKD